MTPQQQNEAIAKWMGWKVSPDKSTVMGPVWISPDGYEVPLPPDFVNDLNAMHEVEAKLELRQHTYFAVTLRQIVSTHRYARWHAIWECSHATAAQRAEALLKTLGLWVEESK